MKKHLPSAAVLLLLLLVFCFRAFTAEQEDGAAGSGSSASIDTGYVLTPTAETEPEEQDDLLSSFETGSSSLHSMPDILVNGSSIREETVRVIVDGSTYISASSLIRALLPDADLRWQDNTLSVKVTGLSMTAVPGNAYFLVNGRYLYVPSTVILQEDELLLPVRVLAEALGCTTVYDESTENILIHRVGPFVTAGTYDEEELYWLSRIIFAEAGNQPMQGRIAVGTVIINRVASEHFPNTIKEVIFSPNQFSPVRNGMIYRDPDEESVIAAMLCLDVAREAGE